RSAKTSWLAPSWRGRNPSRHFCHQDSRAGFKKPEKRYQQQCWPEITTDLCGHLFRLRHCLAGANLLATPPVARLAAFIRIGELVLIKDDADEFGRSVGERVFREQGQHLRLAFEKLFDERFKPRVEVPQCRKPHLPVQTRLVRGAEAGRAG